MKNFLFLVLGILFVVVFGISSSVSGQVTSDSTNSPTVGEGLKSDGFNLTENKQNVSQSEGLKKYENSKFGIIFQYPPDWNMVLDTGCEIVSLNFCGLSFTMSPALSNVTLDRLDIPENLERESMYISSVSVVQLDKPSLIAKACDCKELKDFVTWDYIKSENQNRTFINDNRTLIGNNYSAWQTETKFTGGNKVLSVYSLKGNLGYIFRYSGPSDNEFDKYINGFKNMLNTVMLITPIPEKKPSFLNTNQTEKTKPDTSQNNLNGLQILSHNSYTDSVGFMHVVGEVQNNSPTAATFVKVTGTFYNNNQVVGTQFTYTTPSDIGAGQKAPFDLILTSASVPISHIDHYNLVASSQ